MKLVGYLKKKVKWDLENTFWAAGYTAWDAEPFGGVHPNPTWSHDKDKPYYKRWHGSFEWDGRVPVFEGKVTMSAINRGRSGVNVLLDIEDAGSVAMTLHEFFDVMLDATDPHNALYCIMGRGSVYGLWTFKKQGTNASLIPCRMEDVDCIMCDAGECTTPSCDKEVK
jgi:hypothetical protein